MTKGKGIVGFDKGTDKTKNVMVVDDEDAIRQLVSLILQGAGYSVIEAVNGSDALSKLNTTGVSMVITDLRMPEMDGMALTRELRRAPEYRSLPVIMLSSEFQGYREREGAAAGVNVWMTKPFMTRQLIQTVRKFVPDTGFDAGAAS